MDRGYAAKSLQQTPPSPNPNELGEDRLPLPDVLGTSAPSKWITWVPPLRRNLNQMS